jgi:hypothetical protein
VLNIVQKKKKNPPKKPPLKLFFVLFRRLHGPVQRVHRVRGERDHVSRLHPPPLHPKQQVGPQASNPRTYVFKQCPPSSPSPQITGRCTSPAPLEPTYLNSVHPPPLHTKQQVCAQASTPRTFSNTVVETMWIRDGY